MPEKEKVPICGLGFIKWMDIEKKQWPSIVVLATVGTSSDVTNPLTKKCPLYDEGESSGITNGGEQVYDLSQMLKMLAKLSEEKDLKLSLKINIRKGKWVSENEIWNLMY